MLWFLRAAKTDKLVLSYCVGFHPNALAGIDKLANIFVTVDDDSLPFYA